MTDIDTSKEAVEAHLDVSRNHEAGLIPVTTEKAFRHAGRGNFFTALRAISEQEQDT